MPKTIKDEIVQIKKHIINIYKDIYNSDVVFFEHGSAKVGFAGSSIDHAHLHCIPYQSNLSNLKNTLNTSSFLSEGINKDIFNSDDFNNDYSYIYLESKSCGNIIYKVNSKLISQFMRKIIFELLGDDDYLWQDKCVTPNSNKVFMKTLSDLNGRLPTSNF